MSCPTRGRPQYQLKTRLTGRPPDRLYSKNGILPDLFSEGQAATTHGRLDDSGVFVAHTVLAKHDENYMPAEFAEILEKHGYDAEQSSL